MTDKPTIEFIDTSQNDNILEVTPKNEFTLMWEGQTINIKNREDFKTFLLICFRGFIGTEADRGKG